MKKTVIFALLFLGIMATACTKDKTPKAVIDAFNKNFPNATKVKWDKENETEYEAEFIWNNQEHSANFSDKGVWLETESSINYDNLPEAVKTAFRTTYKNEKVKEVAVIEASNGETKFEIEFKKDHKTKEILFTKEGSLIE